VLAGVREQQGRIDDAINLFERVVQYDRQYQLPKLQENMRRLAALHELQSRDIAPAHPGGVETPPLPTAPAHPEAAITPSRPKPAEAGFSSRGTASVPIAPARPEAAKTASVPEPPGSLKGDTEQA
jgi:hypothetical protein